METALGFALGAVGLRLDDFCRLTPGEFGSVIRAWREERESEMHGEWERTRMLATIAIQPHVKGTVTPERLLPFPWERKKEPEKKPVTREEAHARFLRLMAREKENQSSQSSEL